MLVQRAQDELPAAPLGLDLGRADGEQGGEVRDAQVPARLIEERRGDLAAQDPVDEERREGEEVRRQHDGQESRRAELVGDGDGAADGEAEDDLVPEGGHGRGEDLLGLGLFGRLGAVVVVVVVV